MSLIFFLFFTNINSISEVEQEVEKKEDRVVEKSPTKAVILSLLFPGGGQFYSHRYIKGIIMGGVEIFLGYMAYNENSIFEKEGDYSHIEKRNRYLWYLGGVIIYSMTDAYISAHFYDFKKQEKLIEEGGSN